VSVAHVALAHRPLVLPLVLPPMLPLVLPPMLPRPQLHPLCEQRSNQHLEQVSLRPKRNPSRAEGNEPSRRRRFRRRLQTQQERVNRPPFQGFFAGFRVLLRLVGLFCKDCLLLVALPQHLHW